LVLPELLGVDVDAGAVAIGKNDGVGVVIDGLGAQGAGDFDLDDQDAPAVDDGGEGPGEVAPDRGVQAGAHQAEEAERGEDDAGDAGDCRGERGGGPVPGDEHERDGDEGGGEEDV